MRMSCCSQEQDAYNTTFFNAATCGNATWLSSLVHFTFWMSYSLNNNTSSTRKSPCQLLLTRVTLDLKWWPEIFSCEYHHCVRRVSRMLATSPTQPWHVRSFHAPDFRVQIAWRGLSLLVAGIIPAGMLQYYWSGNRMASSICAYTCRATFAR